MATGFGRLETANPTRFMRVLLFALGVLALVSASLKLRGRIRHQIGTSRLVVVELGLGLFAVLAAAWGGFGSGTLTVIAATTLAAIVGTAVHQGRLAADHQRRRDLSEGLRLQSFVQGGDPSHPGSPPDQEERSSTGFGGPR